MTLTSISIKNLSRTLATLLFLAAPAATVFANDDDDDAGTCQNGACSSCSNNSTYYGNTCWWNDQFLPWYQNDYLLVLNPDMDTITSTIADFFNSAVNMNEDSEYYLTEAAVTGFSSTYYLENSQGYSMYNYYPSIKNYKDKSMTGTMVTAVSDAMLDTTYPYASSADTSSNETKYMYYCSKHMITLNAMVATLGASESDDYGDSYYATASDACTEESNFVNDFGNVDSKFSDSSIYDSGLISAASYLSTTEVNTNCPDNLDTNDATTDLNAMKGSLQSFCKLLKPYYASQLNSKVRDNNSSNLGDLFASYDFKTMRNPVAYQAKSQFDGTTCTSKSSSATDTTIQAYKLLYTLTGLPAMNSALYVPQIPIDDDQVILKGDFESMDTASDNGDYSASKLTDITNYRNQKLPAIQSSQNSLTNAIASFSASMSVPITVLNNMYSERYDTVQDEQTGQVCTQAELDERNANWRLMNPTADGSWVNDVTAMNEVQLLRENAIMLATIIYQNQQRHRDMENLNSMMAILTINALKPAANSIAASQSQIEGDIKSYIAGQDVGAASSSSSSGADTSSGDDPDSVDMD